ncbi:MAG: glycosyltransferase [Planctomycetota bacterium]
MSLRVLLISEACNPEQVSVPLVGYSHCMAIRRRKDIDARLVTQIRNRDALLRSGLRDPEDFVAIDTERIAAPAHRLANRLRGGAGKGWTTVMAIRALTYPVFERQVWKQFGDQLKARQFDVVHRVTPLSPTTPSSLAKRCKRIGVPFIAGPLNGGVPWPKAFDSIRRQEREWLSYVRGVYRWLPGFHGTRKAASALLVGSRDTLEQMPARYRHKCIFMPENGIDPSRFQAHRTRRIDGPLRLIFVGRLVPYKGCDMLVDAAAELIQQGQATLEIVGDGPEMSRLRRQAETLGLGPAIKFSGRLEHDQVQHRMAEADLFVFPSIREFGGAVALESMAVGLVPMVVAYGGLADLVGEEHGFRIPMGSRDEIIGHLKKRLRELRADPSEIEIRANLLRRHVQETYTWDAKAAQVSEIYHQLSCQSNSSRASFETPRTENSLCHRQVPAFSGD